MGFTCFQESGSTDVNVETMKYIHAVYLMDLYLYYVYTELLNLGRVSCITLLFRFLVPLVVVSTVGKS